VKENLSAETNPINDPQLDAALKAVMEQLTPSVDPEQN
jgi:hypothetical protein